MKLKNVIQLLLLATVIMFTAPSCVKEGPMGLQGEPGVNGANGKDGKDASETCKMCHNPTKVDNIAVQFQFSKHEYGEAAFEESGNTGCTPCHAQEAFLDVVKRNVSSGFTLGSNGKYTLDYATTSSTAYGELGCATCHSKIHATYGSSDLPSLTTIAPVPMVMWGGKKTIDLKADGSKSNLCVKCHQPRPQTNLQTGNVQDYAAIAANPTGIAYDANNNTATTNIVRPSYRMHIHYGALGAIYAGMGGVEFAGSLPYTSSAHTTMASCMDCHMGAVVGRSGGHTFNAQGKFDGCNATGCHSTAITTASTTLWATPRAEIKTLLNSLAAKLVVGGVDILNRNPVSSEGAAVVIDGVVKSLGMNLWAGLTTNNYDGYLNVYDPVNNPNLVANNPNGTFQNPSPSGSWTADQKTFNLTLPKLSLTNAQYGACINFQLCLRDYSLGIHNYAYTKALLTNTIAKL